jgi:hypothetical protein
MITYWLIEKAGAEQLQTEISEPLSEVGRQISSFVTVRKRSG